MYNIMRESRQILFAGKKELGDGGPMPIFGHYNMLIKCIGFFIGRAYVETRVFIDDTRKEREKTVK